MALSNFETEMLSNVNELRLRLKTLLNEEQFEDTKMFIRFLIARNCDIKAAEGMLRNHLNWRKQHRADTICSWYIPIEVCEKYVPFNSTIGYSKDGDLIVYIDFGNFDFSGILKSINSQDVVNYIIRHLERDFKTLKEHCKEKNIKMQKWIYIINFENFSLSTATNKSVLETMGKVVTLYEANYPEMLKKAILFNTSWYFQLAYAVVKPLITGNTLQKIEIHGKEGWKKELLCHIDADVLPVFLGGNRTDPNGDPICKTFIKQGEPIPEKYYAINSKYNFFQQPEVKKLVINRLEIVEVELLVPHRGLTIEWEYMTKSRDIGFSLLYKTENDISLEEIIPQQRFDTSVSPECGLLKCEKSGFYILKFDNAYSWLHQKEVYYKAKVVESTS